MALSKRANGREERLRAEATDRLIWGVMLQVEVHETKEKRSSSRRHSVSVCVNAGRKTGEACTTCGRFFCRQNQRSLWKRYRPVWGTALQKESPSRRSGFLAGTFINSTHAHSEFRDAHFATSVCVHVSHFQVKRASTATFTAPQTRSYSHCCHIVDSSGVTSLWWTFSQRKITSSNKTRWQALSYVQVKPPSQDKKQHLYNGTVIGFLCDIKMQSTCDQML